MVRCAEARSPGRTERRFYARHLVLPRSDGEGGWDDEVLDDRALSVS